MYLTQAHVHLTKHIIFKKCLKQKFGHFCCFKNLPSFNFIIDQSTTKISQ